MLIRPQRNMGTPIDTPGCLSCKNRGKPCVTGLDLAAFFINAMNFSLHPEPTSGVYCQPTRPTLKRASFLRYLAHFKPVYFL